MATSHNGWPVITDPDDLQSLNWVTGRVLPGDVFELFDYLCDRFDAEIEPIVRGHSWGWAYRPIRGSSSGFSNHASGTAIDLNAPDHPLGRRGTFTPKQATHIRAILADLGGVIRWGGDYSGRPDEMHFEINADRAAVTRAARRIANLPAARRADWLAARRRIGRARPRPVNVRLVNVASVTKPARQARAIFAEALIKPGPHGPPDLVLAVELSDVRAAELAGEVWAVFQRGELGSPDSALGVAVRRERVRLSVAQLLPGTPSTSEGDGIRARPILIATVLMDPGTPQRWARALDLGHAPPARAPRARARYLAAFVKARGSLKIGDLNIEERWAARILGRRIRSAGVLHIGVPWWIPCTKAARVNVGSDHPALDVTLWPRGGS